MVAATEIRGDVDEILPGVIADRRYLHENPELSFHEVETSKFVQERLKSLGVDDIRAGIAGTGVTALIHGTKGKGKVALVRADMDALPIHEENDVEYKSKHDGVMHACGHDAHTAMLLGLARVLMDRRGEIKGTVKLLFQPAEELPPGGAIQMIKEGVLEDPHVDAVFGLHVAADIPAGRICVRTGPDSAASDRFRIKIQGRGGHAARPQIAIDPVVVGAYIVTALQTLVARETDPLESAVVTVGALLAGEAMNVIPDTAELRGTVRTLSPEVRDLMQERLTEIAVGVGKAMRAEVKVDYMRGYPGIVNDEAMVAIVRQAAAEVVGEENTIAPRVGMGGEDFAYFTLERPGCFFRVGTRNEERGIVWGHHHPRFDVEEEGLAAGIATMANSVLSYLNG